MRLSFVVLSSLVASALIPGLTVGGCVSNDNPSPAAGDDAGETADGAPAPKLDSAIAPDAPAPDAGPADEASAPAEAGAVDASLPEVVLTAASTNVTADGTDTLTVSLNGVTATAIEIDDGTTKVATLTAAPYQTSVSYSFLENGTHTYTAKATLADTSVVTSVAVPVTVNIAANGFFVDPAAGLDTNAGTQAAPFKTIAKAAAALTADGQSLYLATGTHPMTGPITFTHVTHLRAVASGVVVQGTATNTGTNNAFTFATGGETRNIAFSDFYETIQSNAGTFTSAGCSFDSVAAAFIMTGSTVATIDETGVSAIATNWRGGGVGTVLVTDSAGSATFEGGGATITGTAGIYVSPIFVRGHSTAVVSHLTLTGVVQHAVSLFDNGHLTFNDVTITNSGFSISSGTDEAVIAMGGENTENPQTTSFVVNGGGITASTGPAIAFSLYANEGAGQSLVLNGTHLDSSNGQGLIVAGSNVGTTVPTVQATNTTFTGNKTNAIAIASGKVTLTGCTISNTTGTPGDGIQFTDATAAPSLTMRGTTLSTNAGDGLDFNGTTAATLDLGTTASPGGNTFRGVSGVFAAVHVENAIAGQAVGNTWIANQQGADATGSYTTATTLTSATAAGSNAKLATGATLVVK